jgi:4-amino-4-deoxy-L-arabinose transferase-like glycosyltransferase
MELLTAEHNTQTSSAAVTADRGVLSRIRMWFGLATGILALLQFLATRNQVNVDGISYIDMANNYLRSGSHALINGQWSPLYPWLIAALASLVRPSPYWEFTVLHAVNLIACLIAFLAFDWLMREVIENQRELAAPDYIPLPAPTFVVIGYTLFLWYSLKLISIRESSPDMLMSVFVFLAVAMTLRVKRTSGTWLQMCGLGVILGLGYLVKAPMFPLAFVFLAIAFWVIRRKRHCILKSILALAVFLAICAPLIIGLSRSEHRFTFGDSARLNILWNIDHAGPLWYWQTLGASGGKFEHPPERIFQSPPVYKFDAPLPGTQPAWYDPSYWSQGAVPKLLPSVQLSVLIANLGIYKDMLFSEEVALLAALVFLVLLAGVARSIPCIATQWPILVPGVVALIMYALILIEVRYVAVFLALLWIALFAGVRFPRLADAERFGKAVATTIAIAVGLPVILTVYSDARAGLRHPAFPAWQVAKELHASGVGRGDKVARIGGTFAADWAHLLRTEVVAEIPRYQAVHFWSASPASQSQIMDVIHNTGAKAVVAEQIPPTEVFTPFSGWKKVGNTDYYVFVFAPTSTQQQLPAKSP